MVKTEGAAAAVVAAVDEDEAMKMEMRLMDRLMEQYKYQPGYQDRTTMMD
jgi:hypothetical protein